MIKVVAGSSVSMPDTQELRALWPQSGEQKPGCVFPVTKIVGIFALASGALLERATGSLHQHESQLFRRLWNTLKTAALKRLMKGLSLYGLCSPFMHKVRPVRLRGAGAIESIRRLGVGRGLADVATGGSGWATKMGQTHQYATNSTKNQLELRQKRSTPPCRKLKPACSNPASFRKGTGKIDRLHLR